MNLFLSSLGLVALLSMAAGCIAEFDGDNPGTEEENTGTAVAAQVGGSDLYQVHVHPADARLHLSTRALAAAVGWRELPRQRELPGVGRRRLPVRVSTQSPLRTSGAHTSLNDFVTKVCTMSPVPSTFHAASYTPIAGFCSSSPC